MSGAAPLAPELAKRSSERLAKMGAKVFIVQGYGLTETRCVFSFYEEDRFLINGYTSTVTLDLLTLEFDTSLILHSFFYSFLRLFVGVISPGVLLLTPELSVKKVGSVGELLPNVEARLVDEEEKDVRPGQPGELWVRGLNVMK